MEIDPRILAERGKELDRLVRERADLRARLKAAEEQHRYNSEFGTLVELMYQVISGGKWTSSELREAVILATVKHETGIDWREQLSLMEQENEPQ